MKWPYVLITPARNEGRYIAKTIECLLAQTSLPKRWVIVSDGSTDETDAIVNQYRAQNSIITLVRRCAERTRSYGSKVRAIWAGSQELNDIDYDFIGILDADVTFQRDYYERVLKEFDGNCRLGVAGGITVEGEGRRFPFSRGVTERYVPGPIQLFRRQCYEEIGGLRALKYGGEDTVALEMAMMRGWEVRTFPELIVRHHRRVGTEGMGILPARFRHGLEDYAVGYHPVFEIGKCARRFGERPYVLGSLLRMSGYLWGGLVRQKRELPAEFVRHLRTQQIRRLLGR
jgi:biofilm PGA synthesis N-glycosyltransferase PgaC